MIQRFWVWALIIVSISASAAPLQTVVDYLRTTPAWVDGTLQFETDAQVYKSGVTSVKLLAGRQIGYAFGENFLELSPSFGVELKYGPISIKVKNIRWDRNGGFKVETELPLDLNGWGAGYVNEKVRVELEKMFGAKMRQTSDQLRQLRAAKRLSDTGAVMNNIVNIFKDPTGPALPAVRGEMGLVFAPQQNKVLQLGNIRVGIKGGDNIRAAIGFRLSGQGFAPRSINITSRQGIDINEGTEYKPNARLVFSSLDLSSQGMSLGAHLGASETVLGLIIAFQVAAGQAGHPPTQTCMSCLELAELKPIKMIVEKGIRQQVLELIRTQRPQLRAMGVTEGTLRAFERRARCQLNGITCAEECNRKYNSTGQILACKRRCEEIMSDCLQ